MKEKIKEFLKISNFYDLLNENISALIVGDEELSDENKSLLISSLDIEELDESVLPIYEKHFSEKELDEIITFLNSPAGKKMSFVNMNSSDEINDIIGHWISSKYGEVIEGN